MKIGILYSVDRESISNYIAACERQSVEYETVDLCSMDWLDKVRNSKVDFFIQRPEGNLEYRKSMYDERLYIITKVLNKIVFPSYEEVLIYENKKYLSYYMTAKNIPHAKTDVIYYKAEAIEFLKKTAFPIVGKTSIGAAGSGVEILRNKKQALKYVERAFRKNGITRRFGPNPNKGNVRSWFVKSIKNPVLFARKLRFYIERNNAGQRNYVIFQEYINHDFEWRITKCGDYYYAYQKLKLYDKCSGTGLPDGHEIEPPIELLDYVRQICDDNHFNSMAVDILATNDGIYRVNEMQTHWGVDHYDCMVINGKRGIYTYNNGWNFIEGEFWDNNYFDMRLAASIDFYKKQKSKSCL